MKTKNIMLLSDSYKASHWRQYPSDTEYIYSYFEPRIQGQQVVFHGLQYLLDEYCSGQVVTKEGIDFAGPIIDSHMGPGTFNYEGWEYILAKHNGRLPIKIFAVPEGTVVESNNVLMCMVNTDPACYWLTNFMETLLSQVWYPTTVATNSRNTKKDIKQWLINTGCSTDGLGFKLHDFGFRGVSSVESAGIGGLAHLTSFLGTDTLQALVHAHDYYGQPAGEVAGYSIAASEHSTITSWGKDNELDAMKNMLEQYPTGLVACVSDSYDIFRACRDYWGDKLRYDVLKRDGTLVIRPDSGDFMEVLPTISDILHDRFGGTKTSTGHKLLHPKVRLIQGDGISPDTPNKILKRLSHRGFAADNIAFGSGGGLLQKVNRDDFKFAIKCSAICRNGKWHDVWKEPITDSGKNSKRGLLKLIRTAGVYVTVNQDRLPEHENQLQCVFENGYMFNTSTLQEIRNRCAV